MAIIALSSATVLIFQFGRPFGEAVSLSLALMCTMILIHLLISRARDRGAVSEAVDRLEDRMADIDEDVGNLEGRLTGMEHTMPRKTRAEMDPLFAEVEVLGTLVKQMAEAMSDLETRVEDQQALSPPPRAPSLPHYPQTQPDPNAHGFAHQPAFAAPAVPPHAAPPPAGPQHASVHANTQHPGQQQVLGQGPEVSAEPPHWNHGPEQARESAAQANMEAWDRKYGVAPAAAGSAAAPFFQETAASRPTAPEDDFPFGDAAPAAPEGPKPNLAMREMITSALNANRVELFLQPIVTLPQRQVKYYEAFTRLRDAEGNAVEASVFLPEAVLSGQIARIDNLLLYRSLQVIKRLTSRNRNAILFCNISSASLVDEASFPGFLEFVQSNRAYADVLVFEFSQADIANMGGLELESLNALYDAGFRFSIDRISDMKMDFNSLAGRGFKFAKLHGDYLIGRREANHGHIHPSDFGDLLQRYGMELITDHVETESQVLELLDYDVKFAQGNLFSPPRPVRAEVLQGPSAPGPMRTAAG
ncbi:MAG: EAL domain-containing protein [Roseibium sp.]|uniref:EAL domain-containing protein n=1 Tax=Roseibium sp. TaxID=1936156 RepID=UPI003D9C0B4A